MAFKILGRDGVSLITAGSSADNLSAESRKIINLANPTDAQDAATKDYVDNAAAEAGSALDGTFRIKNTSDESKQIAFDASGVAAETTRTIIMPNSNVDLGLVLTAIQSSEKGANNGVATLNSSGKIPNSQIPAIAITDTYVVDSEVEMLALSSAETGDVAVRTDLSKSFILAGDDYATLGDWQELLSPTDAVQSVFGRTGSVTAESGDYSADQIDFTPAGDIEATDVQAAIEELDSEKASITEVTSAIAATYGRALVVSSGTPYDASADIHTYLISGTSAQTFRMPDLALTTDGETYEIINRSTQTVTVQTNSGGAVATLKPQARMSVIAAVSIWATHVLPIYSAVDGSLNLGGVKVTNLADGSVSSDAAAYGQVVTVQTNLDNHINDASDAHDASAISVLDSGNNFTSTDVEGALAEAMDAAQAAQSDADAAQADATQALSDAAAAQADATQALSDAADAQADATEALSLSGQSFEAGVAGEAFGADEIWLVRRAKSGETAGRYYKAQADSAENSRVVGFIVVGASSVSAADSIRVYKLGTAVLGTSDSPFTAPDDLNLPLFLSQDTAGKWTLTPTDEAGDWIKEVGFVANTGLLEFQPGILIQA